MQDYKTSTIDSYNKNAREFAKKFLELMELERRYEFGKFIELLNGKNILDLGCGAGDHSLFFKEQGLNVTAIDLSEEMIKLCKEKKLNAFVMDIEDLKFDNNSFEGIWAVTSLLHIPKSKIDGVIMKLYNLLKQNGILYVCIKEGVGEKNIQDKNGERFFAFWQKEEFLNLVQDKFRLIEFKQIILGHTTFLQFFFEKIQQHL